MTSFSARFLLALVSFGTYVLPHPLPAAEAAPKTWPVQTRAMIGQKAPQDPSTLPKSLAPYSQPVARAPYAGPALVSRGPWEWSIRGGWKLIAAPQIQADGAQISQSTYSPDSWLDATVPGTALTTYIDRGIYPDPSYGLNNLAIPETLNKQDYWYRNEFTVDPAVSGKRLTLTFEGINYAAEVWLNGRLLGYVKGAFIRGVFDVTGLLGFGKPNVLAVRVSPPPHPGIAHEQSMKAGPGENGGMECLDGPTFVATEGWDWIPAVRDRNTGIWQEVTLKATDSIAIGDIQVITKLPLPDTSRADVLITVPLQNSSVTAQSGQLNVVFEGVTLSKQVSVPPGETNVALTPDEFPQLRVAHPRLWWPNGYGSPELYHLQVTFGESDQKQIRFGIREVTYELSLLDPQGSLQRVEISPTGAPGQSLVNVMHEGTIQTSLGWVTSLRQNVGSPGIRHVDDDRAAPFLILKVNGVRIACKGGSWGMDDFLKRVSREHLEPFFRLHRDAHLTMIRNWVGQSTEEAFYDLADEYGLLVWNDFWESTQNYNLEPSDTALFLSNARDTILRFRNHPSIAMWCGRNEGVPSPAVNEGLDNLIRTLDGTRYYSPSSNQINLQNSGPYLYHDPVDYFTKLDRGFAVEVGIPSVPTLEAVKSFIPAPDRWPISDTWAYHDWHQSGNGDTAPFMAALATMFGAATSLDDFEKKAQLINYDSHRAIFEGMNAHLWAPNSGRMLWMTQPAWPSTMWQILSSDYDTQASFFGVMKACEPVHVQMNLPDHEVEIVNNTGNALSGVAVRARLFGLDGKQIATHEQTVQAAPYAAQSAFRLTDSVLTGSDPVFIKLELRDAGGSLLSDNFYWSSARTEAMRKLDEMAPVTVSGDVSRSTAGDMVRTMVTLTNRGAGAALMTKLTLLRARDGTQVLPAYFSDNYVSLLPGETRKITIETPSGVSAGAVKVALRGWNVTPAVFEAP